MDTNLPICVTIQVEATNFSTQRYALEHLVELMKQAKTPETGAIFEDKYWKLTVVERRNLLSTSTEPPTEQKE